MRSLLALIHLGLIAGGLAMGACYNPKIVDGGLRCSAKSECPSGYSCLEGKCRVGGGGGSGGSGGTGGTGGPPPDGSDQMCTTPMGDYGPFKSCAPKIADGCDPVCQAGCKCGERCKLETAGAACRPDQPPFVDQYDRCDQNNDTCKPGYVCIEELATRPDCAAHCYRLCRNDSQCPMGSKCSDQVTVQGNVMAMSCSIPTETCNPFGRASCGMPAQRPYPAFACYTVPGSPDLTACQCAGTIPVGTMCQNYFDCVPGAECVASGGQKQCRQVCQIGAAPLSAGACPATQTCTAFSGATKYGYCR